MRWIRNFIRYLRLWFFHREKLIPLEIDRDVSIGDILTTHNGEVLVHCGFGKYMVVRDYFEIFKKRAGYGRTTTNRRRNRFFRHQRKVR